MTNSVSPAQSRGPLIIGALVVLLVILQQDYWFWNDGTLVFGFMPIGLFWHACISIAAAAVWYLATKIAWPLEDVESSPNADAGLNDDDAGANSSSGAEAQQ